MKFLKAKIADIEHAKKWDKKKRKKFNYKHFAGLFQNPRDVDTRGKRHRRTPIQWIMKYFLEGKLRNYLPHPSHQRVFNIPFIKLNTCVPRTHVFQLARI